MAVSPSSEKALASGTVRDVKVYLLDSGNKQVDYQQSGYICQSAHDEDRSVVVPVGLQDETSRALKEDAAHRTGESTDAHN
jgi:hypothetical protein